MIANFDKFKNLFKKEKDYYIHTSHYWDIYEREELEKIGLYYVKSNYWHNGHEECLMGYFKIEDCPYVNNIFVTKIADNHYNHHYKVQHKGNIKEFDEFSKLCKYLSTFLN